MFGAEETRKLVKEALIEVSEDHHLAVVTIANKDGVCMATAVKINNEWDIQGYVDIHKSQLPNNTNLAVDWGAVVQWSK